MPKPKPGESEDDYVSRCIPIVLSEGTTDDSSQAAAICHSMWQEARSQAGGRTMGREYKSFPALAIKAGDQGEVETIFAVFGNVDEGGDMIHPGAFAKTFTERGNKVMVLDAHNTSSVRDVIGKPVSLEEIGRDELPEKILQEFPTATGGAKARIQFLMDTPEGEGAFKRIKADAVGEWSFGYDVLDQDFTDQVHNGEQMTVRNLRTLKLYEISPVLWGMNPATMTTGAKAAQEPLPEDESMGDPPAESKEGRVLAARNASRAAAAVTALMEILEDAGVDTGWQKRPPQNEDEEDDRVYALGKSAPATTEEQAAIPQAATGAGPSPTPTLERKRLQVLLDIESLT